MVDNQVKAYTQRNGKYDKVDVYEDNDMLKGLLAELDEEGNTKEGGIQVEGAVMMPSYMKNDEQKAIFAGAKVKRCACIQSEYCLGRKCCRIVFFIED